MRMYYLTGHIAHWTYEMLHMLLQPTLEGTLNDMFSLPDETIPLVHLDAPLPNVATLVVSHLVIGVLLSPLELVRTRYGTRKLRMDDSTLGLGYPFFAFTVELVFGLKFCIDSLCKPPPP